MADDRRFLYHVATRKRGLLHAEGASPDEMLKALGLTTEDIKRTPMPVKMVAGGVVVKMPDNVKVRLKELQQERRALRNSGRHGHVCKCGKRFFHTTSGQCESETCIDCSIKAGRRRPPNAEGIGRKGREAMEKSEGKVRENEHKGESRAATPSVEAKEEESMNSKSNAKTKRAKKAAPKSGERAAVAKKERGPRKVGELFDKSVTSVIRWMGKDEFTYDEAMAALKKEGVRPLPAEATVRIQLGAGRRGERGEPAQLSREQQQSLRDAAKSVEEK